MTWQRRLVKALPFLFTAVGFFGAMLYTNVRFEELAQESCESRAEATARAREADEQQLRQLNESPFVQPPPLPAELDAGDLALLDWATNLSRQSRAEALKPQREYLERRLNTIHPIRCDGGEPVELPIPAGPIHGSGVVDRLL